jgi:hypothetical protein
MYSKATVLGHTIRGTVCNWTLDRLHSGGGGRKTLKLLKSISKEQETFGMKDGCICILRHGTGIFNNDKRSEYFVRYFN